MLINGKGTQNPAWATHQIVLVNNAEEAAIPNTGGFVFFGFTVMLRALLIF